MTQEELACRLGFLRYLISGYETGRHIPTAPRQLKMAKFFSKRLKRKITPADIFPPQEAKQ